MKLIVLDGLHSTHQFIRFYFVLIIVLIHYNLIDFHHFFRLAGLGYWDIK